MAWLHTFSTRSLYLVLYLCLFIILCAAQEQPELPRASQGPEFNCIQFGVCEKCPPAALHEPYCQPYGSRRLLHCTPRDEPPNNDDHGHIQAPGAAGGHKDNDGHTPAWESCGRTHAKEREEYWQFVLCNLFFTLLGLVLLFSRSQVVASMQARRLAARIGVRWNAGIGTR
ncbi:hypothetical protein BKA62DRAFT_64255 [Auriculariales sp. MPI-PUGE-AT-0066]|nr:hypothetical protein BKA62DRAFT_64255 [Auriculariales sp. MPI-PUGE-AT-0066]